MTVAAESGDTLLAREVINEILVVLTEGPQSPCHLVHNMGIREDLVNAYLAELLAREWVVIVSDEAAGTGQNDLLQKSLADAYSEHRRLVASPLFSEQNAPIQLRSRLWLTTLERLFLAGLTQIALLVITPDGACAADNVL